MNAQHEEFDAVIVGARCAGAATAMLMARAGLRVLVVDRTHPSRDTLWSCSAKRVTARRNGPDGAWTMWSDVDPSQSCQRYWGNDLQRAIRAPIDIAWPGPSLMSARSAATSGFTPAVALFRSLADPARLATT